VDEAFGAAPGHGAAGVTAASRLWIAGALGLALAACLPAPELATPPPAPDSTVTSAARAAATAGSTGAEDGCSIFPADNIWNTVIADAPVDPLSDAYVQSIGLDEPMHPDFGQGLWDDGPIGIPYAEAGSTTPREPVEFYYPDESDPGPYPIPTEAPVEGGPDSDGDRHILTLETDECRLYELYDARLESGRWTAGSGAIFDLRSNTLRPAGWTSADAAGLPIFPGLVRFEDVASGEIRHALRFTAPQTQRAYVWPARHFASDFTDSALPPMGQRFRLRADFDLEPFSPDVRVILRALQTYGMMLADNGSPWFLSGAPDERWDNEVLHELAQVHGRDFEAVDVSGMVTDPATGRARP